MPRSGRGSLHLHQISPEISRSMSYTVELLTGHCIRRPRRVENKRSTTAYCQRGMKNYRGRSPR